MIRRDNGPMDLTTAAGIVLGLAIAYSAWLPSIIFAPPMAPFAHDCGRGILPCRH
jgi:hypothetical protein